MRGRPPLALLHRLVSESMYFLCNWLTNEIIKSVAVLGRVEKVMLVTLVVTVVVDTKLIAIMLARFQPANLAHTISRYLLHTQLYQQGADRKAG